MHPSLDRAAVDPDQGQVLRRAGLHVPCAAALSEASSAHCSASKWFDSTAGDSAVALLCSWLKRCVGSGHREGAIDASASNALGLSFHARIGVQDDWLRHSEAWLDERAASSYADAVSRSDPFAAAGLAMLELRGDAGGPSHERALQWLSTAAAVGAPELHPSRPWPSMKRLEALFAASRWRLAQSSFVSVLGDEFGISPREAQALYVEVDVDGVGFVEWSGSPDRCRPPSRCIAVPRRMLALGLRAPWLGSWPWFSSLHSWLDPFGRTQ